MDFMGSRVLIQQPLISFHTTIFYKNYTSMVSGGSENRKSYTVVGDTNSNTITSHHPFSLPQGSNLGPWLFLIHIYDIFRQHGKIILFADVAVLIYFETDPVLLGIKIQGDLKPIANWLLENKLTLNVSKTKSMLISTNMSIRENTILNLRLYGKAVEQITSFKYLEIRIQNDMKWNVHIDHVRNKIASISEVESNLQNREKSARECT